MPPIFSCFNGENMNTFMDDGLIIFLTYEPIHSDSIWRGILLYCLHVFLVKMGTIICHELEVINR